VMGRGVLQRVIRRTVDKDGLRASYELKCGHTVTRSSGNLPDRCYCLTCPSEETERERGNRLSRERRARKRLLLLGKSKIGEQT